MRHFSYIHSVEDVAEVLGAAADLGLIIRRDEPTSEPAPDIVDLGSIPTIREGLFDAYMQEWVFGKLFYNKTEASFRRGMYDQRPSTNCVKIHLSFRAEHWDCSHIRLGNGTISRDVDWYNPDDHSVHRASNEVKKEFDTLYKEIITNKYIIVGKRKYHLLKGSLRKIQEEAYLPPFDFMDNEPILG